MNNELTKEVNIKVKYWQGVIALIITICGLVASAFSYGVAYELRPIWETVRDQNVRIDAIEKERDTFLEDHERIIRIQKDVQEIMRIIGRMETQLDSL